METVSKKGRGLAIFLNIIAVVMTLVFIYMVIENVMYIRTYAASYGMPVSDMLQEAIKYVIAGSVEYLVYALILFASAKTVSMVSELNAKADNKDEAPKTEEVDFEAQDAEEVECETLEPEKTESETPGLMLKKRRYIK